MRAITVNVATLGLKDRLVTRNVRKVQKNKYNGVVTGEVSLLGQDTVVFRRPHSRYWQVRNLQQFQTA